MPGKGRVGARICNIKMIWSHAEKARGVIGNDISIGDTDPCARIVRQAIVIAFRQETTGNRGSGAPFGGRKFRGKSDVVGNAVNESRTGDDQIRALAKLGAETHRNILGIAGHRQPVLVENRHTNVGGGACRQVGQCGKRSSCGCLGDLEANGLPENGKRAQKERGDKNKGFAEEVHQKGDIKCKTLQTVETGVNVWRPKNS